MFFSSMWGASGAGNTGKWISSVTSSSSIAGINVTPEVALKHSAVWACVTLLSESMAQLPCELYRKKKDGGREKATDHPLYRIIHTQPNQKDDHFSFTEMKQAHLGLRGNAYSIIDRDSNGYVEELIQVHPDQVQNWVGKDGLPYYFLPQEDKLLPMRKMHHIKWFSLDGYVGMSPIQCLADSIGTALATDQHAGQFFANGTSLGGVIEAPSKHFETQEKLDAFLNKFTDRHSGSRNFFNVSLLQEGMKFNQMALAAKDAQLLESRAFGVIDICRMYKVPPHMAQSLEKSSFNNIEHQGLQFVIYTLMPWIKRHESAMMRDLLLPGEQSEYYIEFNVSGLLRGDQKSRYEAYAIGRQWGWLSVNDIRRLENMPPIKGGDKYLTPLNMVDSQQIADSYRTAGMEVSEQQVKEIEAILKCKSN